MPNRLARESSPYLRQHAENPVDWYPWGEEALERARREAKPIFLSIGYGACHWCHVMDRESFEDPETARVLNEHFVSIKVDREERPDIDSVYMESVQAMTGSGGWPMSVFLTPEKKPFFGGTYFPPEDRHGLPSFRRVLTGVAEAFRKERAGVEERAEALASRLGRSLPLRGTGELRPSVAEQAVARLAEDFDEAEGGFGGAPKFPQPMNLEFLLRHARRTGDPRALRMAAFTFERMARGGIHDHLGGGFHRYSTDARWVVPHFEKMLYDNAQLARLGVHLYQMTGRPLFRDVARGTLDYLLREMTAPRGGFYSTQDADSNGSEGSFFVWTEEEIRGVLGEEAGLLFARAYGVTARGNFDGKCVLTRRGDTGVPDGTGLSGEEREETLRRARALLFAKREKRPRPARDDKVIVGWNGLLIGALAEGAEALGDEGYREAGVRAAAFAEDALHGGGKLRHQWVAGSASGLGFLDDHAFLGEGLLALYQSTFDIRWFRFARARAEAILDRFSAGEDGGFFDADRDHETPIARPKNLQDNVVPSGNASAARFLLLMAAYTGEERFGSPARRAVASMQELMARHPLAFGHWLGSLEFLLAPPREVAIIGEKGRADTDALVRAAFGAFNPNQVVALGDAEGDGGAIPLLAERRMIDGAAIAYICRSFACQAPVTDPEKLATELAS